ncbi:DDE-type integrase/transposase/recombinase [Mycobacterium sp. KBS0706]|uniref:Mu transposase C-terminal domain-containing protein n=1 Tax=Mycobacterium sp. KBS0706 TaxID=2578109 RepID=UPI00110FC4E7|nr:Mu transposase C-terminal domain-containing protein [Mycobacterium sp. KBS0706]TSD85990.1 DDE-type integrase/transposase/recombinase [Mycobacterium sp. KBS0706]
MTEAWFTAKALAGMGLPGLSSDFSTIIRRAKRESWPARERQGRGGGREYPISALPTSARTALARRALQVPMAVPAPQPIAPVRAEHLKIWQRTAMDARAELVAEVVRLQAALQMSRSQAAALLAEQAQSGALRPDLTEAARAANARTGASGARTLSYRSLMRWCEAADAAGAVALAPREAAPARPVVPEWVPPFWRLWAQPQKWSIAHCLERLGEALPANVAAPSYDQVKRFLRQMSVIDRNRGRVGPRQLKTMRAYVTRDFGDLWPTAIYVADGHTFDAEIAHPIHGQPFRPEVTVVIDVATRAIVGWSIGIVENTWGVADALRHACETWGVPALWYVDRGKGFNNAYFDGPHTGFLARLGVHKENSLPYSSQARGVVERVHQSCLVRAAKELPTYIGAKMDEEAKHRVHKLTRADIKMIGRSRLLMSFDDFREYVGAQVAAYNGRRHSELGMSPLDRWEKLFRDQPDTMIDRLAPEEAVDLFRPTVERVARRGQVELWTNIYFLRDLEHHHGETVQVGFDLHDASQVWVRDQAGRLIGIAKLDGNKVPFMPVVTRAEREQQIRTKGRRDRLNRDLAVVEAELNGGPPLIEHAHRTTVDEFFLDAARQQLDAMEAVSAAPTPAAANAGEATTRPIFGTDHDFAAWLAVNPRLATSTDLAWLKPRLADPHFLLLLDACSIDVEALNSLCREAA